MDKPIEIPQTIDAPMQFMLWTIDDAIPFSGIVGYGIMIDQMTLSILVGFLVSYYYRRFRESNPDGILLHACYWLGIIRRKSLIFPDPYVRQLLP